ncbi:MAG: amino acid permease [Atopobiaceae bacterium]|nr:amino acid permease [Atopobiaceae bacterium]
MGTSIGWGSLVVTCSSYLLKAGIAGSIIGMLLGGLLMTVVGKSYLFLMRSYPEAGGTYAFVRELFGHDYGFLAAWFLALTYLAIFWANATSLPLFARYFVGDFFRVGYLYSIFGYDIYLGETLLVIAGILLTSLMCLSSRKTVARIMVLLIIIMVACIVVCLAFALVGHEVEHFNFYPAFIQNENVLSQISSIAFMSPWAFIGFESVSHYSEEITFKQRRLNRVLFSAIIVVTLLYSFIILLSTTAYPSAYSSWFDYIKHLDSLTGIEALPAFYATQHYLGNMGITLLALALLALVLTSLLGNLIALSRLFFSLARDGILAPNFAVVNKRHIPHRALLLAMGISLLIPLVGRTAIGWIIDVTTIGATVVYAFVSASAIRQAKSNHNRLELVVGWVGLIVMIVFGIRMVALALLDASGIAAPSYLLFTIWSILGIFYFRTVFKRDTQRRFGNSVIVWIGLLALILITSVSWYNDVTRSKTDSTIQDVSTYFRGRNAMKGNDEELAFVRNKLRSLEDSNSRMAVGFVILFALAIGVVANNYTFMRRRVVKTERELITTKGLAYRDALTGVRNKQAFVEYQETLDELLESNDLLEFSYVVFDVNGLKYVNDTFGHEAGDEYIRSSCTLICKLFKHSPVFRIGGDEFTAVLMGDDYNNRDALLSQHDRLAEIRIGTSEPVIAAGICDYSSASHSCSADVFREADANMYVRKQELKDMGARAR